MFLNKKTLRIFSFIKIISLILKYNNVFFLNRYQSKDLKKINKKISILVNFLKKKG